jgi:hypothetical protein
VSFEVSKGMRLGRRCVRVPRLQQAPLFLFLRKRTGQWISCEPAGPPFLIYERFCRISYAVRPPLGADTDAMVAYDQLLVIVKTRAERSLITGYINAWMVVWRDLGRNFGPNLPESGVA